MSKKRLTIQHIYFGEYRIRIETMWVTLGINEFIIPSHFPRIHFALQYLVRII